MSLNLVSNGEWGKTALSNLFTGFNDKGKQIKTSDYQEFGNYPVIDQSEADIAGYYDDETKVIKENLPLIIFGDHTRHVKFIHVPFVPGADGTQIISPHSNFDRQFVYYLVCWVAERIGNHGYDRHYKHLKEFEVTYPKSLVEQCVIGEVLSKIDLTIRKTKELIEKYKRIKTGMMQDLLTRGIDEEGNIRSEETHEFKDSPFGRIPKDWDIEKISDYSEKVTSGSRGWAKYYSEEGAKFIRIGNLKRAQIELDLSDVKYINLPSNNSEGMRTQLKTNDLLISITADLGIIGVIPESFGEAYINQHIALVRLKQDEINPRFVGYFFTSENAQRMFEFYNDGGTKAGLNLQAIGMLTFIKPDIIEQDRIVLILDKINTLLSENLLKLNKLKKIKTGLMQDLLTGKVQVTDLKLEEVGIK
nr:restriction endonuclease subunit S [Lysinibacillus sphaericus]